MNMSDDSYTDDLFSVIVKDEDIATTTAKIKIKYPNASITIMKQKACWVEIIIKQNNRTK